MLRLVHGAPVCPCRLFADRTYASRLVLEPVPAAPIPSLTSHPPVPLVPSADHAREPRCGIVAVEPCGFLCLLLSPDSVGHIHEPILCSPRSHRGHSTGVHRCTSCTARSAHSIAHTRTTTRTSPPVPRPGPGEELDKAGDLYDNTIDVVVGRRSPRLSQSPGVKTGLCPSRAPAVSVFADKAAHDFLAGRSLPNSMQKVTPDQKVGHGVLCAARYPR